jgi:hypothetical protein
MVRRVKSEEEMDLDDISSLVSKSMVEDEEFLKAHAKEEREQGEGAESLVVLIMSCFILLLNFST